MAKFRGLKFGKDTGYGRGSATCMENAALRRVIGDEKIKRLASGGGKGLKKALKTSRGVEGRIPSP